MVATQTAPKHLFAPGAVTVTEAVQQAFAAKPGALDEFLERHLTGDWGHPTAARQNQNRWALLTGKRIVSAYVVDWSLTIWIETNGARTETWIGSQPEWDRRQREWPPAENDPEIQRLRAREAELTARLEQLGAKRPSSAERGEAQAAVQAAEQSLHDLLQREATGMADADSVQVAERVLAGAQTRASSLERRHTALTQGIEKAAEELRSVREQREQRRAALLVAEDTYSKELVSGIGQYERQAQEALEGLTKAWRLVATFQAQRERLTALGARPNPHFLNGADRVTRAALKGESLDLDGAAQEPWLRQ